jgi:hypothetical protein
VGAPAGKSFGVSAGRTEEADEGREMLNTESQAVGADESLWVASVVGIVEISSTVVNAKH